MMSKWLDLVAYDPRDNQYKTKVRIVLDDLGQIAFEGDQQIINTLKTNGVESSRRSRTFFPTQSLDFLSAVAETFDNPMLLQATQIHDGLPPTSL